METPCDAALIAEAIREEVRPVLPGEVTIILAPAASGRWAVHFALPGSGLMGENTASFCVEVGDEGYRIVKNPLDGEPDEEVPYDSDNLLRETSRAVLEFAKRISLA